MKKIWPWLLSLFIFPAGATWLDGDASCNTYGCVIVCDLNTCDVYDVRIFPGTGTVPVGGQLIPYTGNPIIGTGVVNTNYRNTFTNVTVPAATSGTNIQINNPLGGPNPTLPTDGGAIGYLDAGDTLVKFGMQANTNIGWRPTPADPTITAGGTNPQRHVFFITSRNVAIDIRAGVTNIGGAGQFNTNVPPANITYSVNYTLTGTNAGTQFGTNATVPGGTFINAGIANLGAIGAGPTTVASFTRAQGIRNNNFNGNTVAAQLRQCIRFEANYTIPNFDLSLGNGTIHYRIDYNFYRR